MLGEAPLVASQRLNREPPAHPCCRQRQGKANSQNGAAIFDYSMCSFNLARHSSSKDIAKVAPYVALIAALLTIISFIVARADQIVALFLEIGAVFRTIKVPLSQFYPVIVMIAFPIVIILLSLVIARDIRRKAARMSAEYDKAARKEYDSAMVFFSVADKREDAREKAREAYLRAIEGFEMAASPAKRIRVFPLKLRRVASPYGLRLKGNSYAYLYELTLSKDEKTRYLQMAVNCLEEAAKEYLEGGDIDSAGQCYRAIAQLCKKENRKRDAMSRLREAEKMFLQASLYSRAGFCSKERSELTESPEEQIDLLAAAARWFETDGYLWESAIMHRQIGYLDIQKENREDAALNFERAAKLFEQDLYFWEAAETYKKTGETLDKIGRSRRARECYEKALEGYRFAGYEYEERQMLGLMEKGKKGK